MSSRGTAGRGASLPEGKPGWASCPCRPSRFRTCPGKRWSASSAKRRGRREPRCCVAAVAAWHPELELPDLSTETVLERAPEWLPPFLGKASTTAELKRVDLCEALWSLLDWSQRQAVERLAPSHITVPTGSRIRVEYRQGADAPVVRVRLQECFGLMDTPRVDEGRRPVLMELLSPGFKPVQLTADLRSFWEGTYFEVRKELKRRYPKHAWPDDPLAADPVRGAKKKS